MNQRAYVVLIEQPLGTDDESIAEQLWNAIEDEGFVVLNVNPWGADSQGPRPAYTPLLPPS